MASSHRYLATTARGAEEFLVQELERLGAEAIEPVPGGAVFEGSLALGMEASLWLRTATRVQLEIGDDDVRDEDDLYDAVRAVDLDRWFDTKHTIAVSSRVSDRRFRNSHYASLVVKDAICDYLLDRFDQRPDVNKRSPDISVSLYLRDGVMRLYLGLQGAAPLNRRGYRGGAAVAATLKETLAATLLGFSGWRPDSALLDPMCGSGTIAIEAALTAANRAPGLNRSHGFERWPGFEDELEEDWRRLTEEARARAEAANPEDIVIRASDIDTGSLKAAKRAAAQAGVLDLIEFEERDIADLVAPPDGGHLVTNPPYGERLGEEEDAIAVHETFSRIARTTCTDHTLTFLSTRRVLKRGVHLRPDARLAVYNGKLECQMARYSLGRRHSPQESR